MDTIQEVYRLAKDNARAIRGEGREGGLVKDIAVIRTKLDGVQVGIDGVSRQLALLSKAQAESINSLRAEVSGKLESEVESINKDQQKLKEEIRADLDQVRGSGPDWKWIVTTFLSIMGPIVVGVILTYAK